MNRTRFKLDQNRAPIHEALENFRRMRVVPFDVPGHKRGRGNPELTEFLGQKCVGVDVNSMKPLDNLCHPVSVIREAEELAADAFGAAHAFLMVGGTTSSVQTMVLTACRRGDEIILPRNVHRSVLNALVLCGAIPVYVNPEVDQRLGISLGMRREQVAKAIKEHPNAVAVLVNNPTYYGICSDLRAIVRMAHEAGMLCLADEAHGTHFYFGGGLPVSAMEAGADMASVSMHKSGGSLTQSSLLLTGPGVHAGYVRQIINLTQTTSGSYLLMSSLDISRRNLAQRGRQIFHQVADMAEYAREEINAIGGYYAFGKELVNGDSVFDFDITKLSVHTLDIGLAGIEVYDILRDEYDIQIEFGDIGNILAYLSIGDRAQEVERLVSALAEIRRRFQKDKSGLLDQEYIDPQVVTSPQEAFYAEKCSLPLRETEGKVCSEFVMCYPPGIPILAPGERITPEILDYIEYAKAKGCNMTGPEDPDGLRRQAGAGDHLGLNASLPATCFPTAAGVANSWDEALGEEIGEALAEEAVTMGVNVILGPGLNIKRSPLCGRNFEYFSEDPYHAGKMAAAYVRGIQSKGIAACPKHFAANSQELHRMANDSVVDERTFREMEDFRTSVHI